MRMSMHRSAGNNTIDDEAFFPELPAVLEGLGQRLQRIASFVQVFKGRAV
jgi:hypothetical protein